METRRVFLLLVALHKVSADVTATSEDAACESQLETMKSQLEKVQQAATKSTLLIEGPAVGKAHWPTDHNEYVPPLVLYWHELGEWMKTMKLQWVAAVVSMVFGMLCLLSGPAAFLTVIVWGCALVAAGSVKYEVELVWPDLNMALLISAAVEGGLITAWILYKSFDGVKMVLGAALGLFVANALNDVAHTEYWPLNASLAWYSVWGFIGIAALTVAQKQVLAILAPALGGFLCSSAFGFLVMEWAWGVFIAGHPPNVPSYIDVRGDCWLDFARQLMGSSTSAGIFQIYSTPGFPVSSVNLDRLGGRVLWLLFFYVGMKHQRRKARQVNDSSLKDSLLGKQKKEYEPYNNYP